jgi:hypothetical protein
MPAHVSESMAGRAGCCGHTQIVRNMASDVRNNTGDIARKQKNISKPSPHSANTFDLVHCSEA